MYRFLDNIFYRAAGRIAAVMRNIQNHYKQKDVHYENENWNKLFNGKDFFEHDLSTNIKINLYKDSVLSRLIYNGFENEETNYLKSVLNQEDIFIDVGANVGLFSIIASNIVGPNGKVICFEPSPTTFLRLDENIKLNNFKNIDHRNIGLSDKKEELTFFISDSGYDAWNSFAQRADLLKDTIKVPVSTLDFELREIDKSRIKLVKIDVEGWEKFVLYGGKSFFINFSPIVMIEFTEENTFNAGYPVYEIYDLMKEYGYEWFSFENGVLVKESKKLHYPYNNLIAVKLKDRIN